MQITDSTVPGPTSGSAAASMAAPAPNRVVGSERVPVRRYEPAGGVWATLVWAHGGSFVRGTLDWPEADWAARRFAEAGIRVYSVDYALASDAVKAPAPSNDVAAVLRWAAAEHDGPIAVGGASAGGHLAVLAALTQAGLAARAEGRAVDALLLEYPTLHRVQREDAALAAATAALPEQRRFGVERIAEMYAFYLGAGSSASSSASSGAGAGASIRAGNGKGKGNGSTESEIAEAGETPQWVVAGELPAERLAALPPVVIVNADRDELRASGEQFAEQLRAAGVPVSIHVQPGTVHGYLNRPEESDRARSDARASIARFVEELSFLLGRG